MAPAISIDNVLAILHAYYLRMQPFCYLFVQPPTCTRPLNWLDLPGAWRCLLSRPLCPRAVTVMDVPAGGTLATRLERQWFGGPNAPGAPPTPQPPPDARGSVDGAPASSDTGGEDEDAVETSSAVAESIGSRVRWPHSAAA